ncbi:MAG: hypothetical protein ABIK09_18400 [Pseudomonadota bacterium]
MTSRDPARYGYRVLILWLLFFVMTIGTELGSGLTEAMLLSRIGASKLAHAFIIEALLRLGSTLGYLWFADRVRSPKLFHWISWLNLGTGFLLAGALAGEVSGAVLLFYCVVRVMENILILHWGVFLLDFFTVRESARAFPVVYSAAQAATFAAGFALSSTAGGDAMRFAVGLYLVAGVALLVMVYVSRTAHAASPRIRVGKAPPHKTLQGLVDGWRFIRRAPLVRYMVLASVAMVLMRRLLQYAVGENLEAIFSDETSLRRYIANYMMIASAVTFVLQALVAGPILDRLGATWVNAAFAWFMLLASMGLAVAPGFATVTLAKSANQDMKQVFKTPVTLLQYGTFPDAMRGRVRSVIFGVAIPLATLASGLILVGFEEIGWLRGGHLDLLVILTGVVFVVASHYQNRGYRLSLVDLLRKKIGAKADEVRGSQVSMARWDGRLLQVREVRRSPLALLRRSRVASTFSMDLEDTGSSLEDLSDDRRLKATEDLMMLVELYRPRGEGHLRSLLLSALEDPRKDVRDTAYMAVRGILPYRYAAQAKLLFE